MSDSHGQQLHSADGSSTESFHFVEVGGLVLRAYLPAPGTDPQPLPEVPSEEGWRFERGCNHDHPTTDFNREALRIAREYGEELTASLQSAFPHRGFVIDYLEEQISFYSRGTGGPEQDIPPTEPLREKAYCEACGKSQPYHLRTEPDPEFPNADWGDCRECGGEVLVRTGESLVVIGLSGDATTQLRPLPRTVSA